jgi:hypothetical protein
MAMRMDSCTALTTTAMDVSLPSTPRLAPHTLLPSESQTKLRSVPTETTKMNNYAFEIILADITEITEELANKLFEAGGDDCLPSSCNGVVTIGFDREAVSIEKAIRSALKTIHDAGYTAKMVVSEPESFLV